MKQASTPQMDKTNNTARGSVTGKNKVSDTTVSSVRLTNVVKFLLVCTACWLMPSVAKADTPIPTGLVSNYNPALQRLTLNVDWFWSSQASNKYIGAAVFADLNGDGIIPSVFDNPATYTSGGNPFPAGLQARDEFLGQLAISNINGSATSAMFPAVVDNTDNGVASGVAGVTPTTAIMLFPYGTNSIEVVNASGNDVGSFTLTYNNLTVNPTKICVVLYDPHSNFTSTGGHSVVSAGPNHNEDNSVEEGNTAGTVSCTGQTNLQCAINKTEGPCQTQAAINASYTAWLNSVTASGCNGVLTNNSTGAPSACGGSKTVTWTYTQTGCANQSPTTTCSATFTVTADATPPVFTFCPPSANLGCNPGNSVPPPGTPTATDNCANSSITFTSSLGPITVSGNQRTQTRTYVATDGCGNSATCQQVFTWLNCGANPDFNVTYVNVPVPGNVSTNDVVPAGTTYGTPTLTSSPIGSAQTNTMTSTGSYTFQANTPGVYVYEVPVCVPGAPLPCPTTTLTITVLDNNINNNPPVANPDIAFTKQGVAVTINTLANDKAGNPGGSLNPASVTVIVNATNGTTTINPATGNNTYTPNPGFTGLDILTYRVCDNSVPTPLCATAKQYIWVLPANAPNTTMAADDYAFTPVNVAVSGNVKNNDTDPEGHTQTVTAQNSTVAGKGTLSLASTGAFTFTPVAGFTGPVSFVYQTCDNGAPQACANATLYILVSPENIRFNPDINATYVNVPVPGNVRTNDVVPAGTNYGTPTVGSVPFGSTHTITMNANGTYTFVANMKGVYTFNVPVCVPGQVPPCPTTLLTITVLDHLVNNNPPVANTDIAITKQGVAVTIPTLANDKAGNPGGSLNPASVTVIVNAANGSSTINLANGNNTYTPNAGFTGIDVLTYQVCDNSAPALCATAKQYILVLPSNAPNSTLAADDYVSTNFGTPVTGNVKTNDTDPEGNTQTVTPQNTVVAQGTLSLLADGSFTFTPAAGFSGPVSFPYTTCDNGVPSACANATLYILVAPQANLFNPDINATYVNVPVPGNVRTNDVVPAGTTYGTSPAVVSTPGGSIHTLTMNANGTYTFVANMKGVYTFNVPVCVPGQVPPCPTSLLTITVLDHLVNNNPPVANTDIAVTKQGVAVIIPTLANDKAGNPGGSLNPASVTVIVNAANGSSTINPANGNNTYTPNAGFTGIDVLTYQVCDNSAPVLCATAKQYILVLPSNAPNSTLAADDYASTNFGTPVSGNVKTNDIDPEGNTQTVAPQNLVVAQGTLSLLADGSFTFTPAAGFSGPVSFPYTTCDNGVPSACANATLYILVVPQANLFNPDMNVTYVNVSVDGNVRTNDVVPAGTTYGVPTVASVPPGSAHTLTLNPSGTYTFIANTKGVYVFNVPVCVPGQVAPCPTATLTITVLDATVLNPPVANPDIAVTKAGVAVTLNTLANDKGGYPGATLNPASVVVIVNATNGSTTVNPANGNTTYTPNAGFTGLDILTYQVCDATAPTPLCATAKQYILVLPANAPNSTLAADDYAYTPRNTPVSGNVKTNDTDPEGNTQTVTPQNVTVAGKGTLSLAADGSFTFTPVTGFTGPVSFVYQTCDNGVPVACANATLYILVSPPNIPDFTPSHDIDALSFTAQTMTRDLVVNITEVLNGFSQGQLQFRVRKLSAFTITYNPTATSANVFGGTPVNNNEWIFTEDANFITVTLKPGVVITNFQTKSIGFTITRNQGVPINTTQNITTSIVTGSGGDSNSANNQVVTSITAN